MVHSIGRHDWYRRTRGDYRDIFIIIYSTFVFIVLLTISSFFPIVRLTPSLQILILRYRVGHMILSTTTHYVVHSFDVK